MTEFDTPFYFRIEPEFGIMFLQVYERRISKRWYQREFVPFGDMVLVHSHLGETPMAAANRALNDERLRAAARAEVRATTDKYSDYTKIDAEEA